MNRETASTLKLASLQLLFRESDLIKVRLIFLISLPQKAEFNLLVRLVEHVVELNTPAFFLRHAALATLTSGTTTMIGGGISATFVRQAPFRPILNNPPVLTGGDQSLVPLSE
ncbi:CAZyme family GH18 [Penicillium herquei]|nr:CAZyme family GH18 [Penicillium herquei]